ncbi:MAG: iron-containing alcohol dehydrogenase, partial [Lachnospiraceae bacterium]|nr:iron-containing alcohol dehydrogenase [Lachnospiraceae bacterium]
ARYVYKDCLPRFVKFAVNVMGEKRPDAQADCQAGNAKDGGWSGSATADETLALRGIEDMEEFFREIKMPTNLRELGVDATDEQLAEMARKCAEGVGGCVGSAKKLREEDMLAIYRASR